MRFSAPVPRRTFSMSRCVPDTSAAAHSIRTTNIALGKVRIQGGSESVLRTPTVDQAVPCTGRSTFEGRLACVYRESATEPLLSPAWPGGASPPAPLTPINRLLFLLSPKASGLSTVFRRLADFLCGPAALLLLSPHCFSHLVDAGRSPPGWRYRPWRRLYI